jgi:ABC-2 type transport system permease protein
MQAAISNSPQPATRAVASTRQIYQRAFLGLMLRDFQVLRREFPSFVVRICMNPILFLFVFTFVMPHLGQAAIGPTTPTGPGFGTVLLPGLMAVAIMFSGIAAVALPLTQEFGVTREIDDRVMCPLPVAAVALCKVCFSALQSIVAAIIVFPLAYYIPTTRVQVDVQNWGFLIVVMLLACFAAGSLGLTIGTSVKPHQIGLIFGVVIMPITFLGCVYYPWAYLNHIRWLQMLVLVNPIVYMTEGLRASLTPALPHMPAWLIITMLLISNAVLMWTGVRGFLRRVIS